MADDGGMTTGSRGSMAPMGDPGSTQPIDSGMPSGGSPGNGDLAPGPTAGGGVIAGKDGSGFFK